MEKFAVNFGHFKEEVLFECILQESAVACLQYDKCEYDDAPCDQCGDSVTTTTWVL